MNLPPDQIQQIYELREQEHKTKRVTSDELEDILYIPFTVMDHGFVRVIDYMGNDGAIVQAARVSYGRGTRKVSDDAALINYLMRHRHTTPFEMCEIKFHIKLPIFVARQWLRHRTASVNEYSARYSILDREFYIPSAENLAAQSKDNRQGRGEILTGAQAHRVLEILREDAQRCHDNYLSLLNEDGENPPGLARELARMNLTLNTYTQFYWKIDLHNLLHFLRLRLAENAQYEIRVYAQTIGNIVKGWVPIAYQAFAEHCLKAVTLSEKEVLALREVFKDTCLDQTNPEIRSLLQKLWAD